MQAIRGCIGLSSFGDDVFNAKIAIWIVVVKHPLSHVGRHQDALNIALINVRSRKCPYEQLQADMVARPHVMLFRARFRVSLVLV